MSDRTIRVVPGYGESLRRQLEAIEWTQSQLMSESRVSRQTISRAINRNEVSNHTRRRIDAALERAPAKRFATSGRNPRRRPSVPGGALCDATDLAAWADRRKAQGVLPLVIRRLILATGVGVTKLHVRTGEGVHLPGWDGIVHADRGTAFVPKGISGWEMSVGAPPKRKAEDNWEKRLEDGGTVDPVDATFVFVTPRRWPKKEEWAAEKIADGRWRDVRVLDADDLAAWLEETPAVHTWLSILMGRVPPNTLDLRSHWEEWSGATSPALTPRLLLSGRQQSVSSLRQRLSNMSGQVFAIQAESGEEAIAWLHCAICEFGPEQAEAILARCLVVKSNDALRHLVSARSPLVLVPTFHPEELASAAARAGHAVVVPLDEAAPGQESEVIRLEPLFRQSAAEALRELGLDHDPAYRMAGLARRSLTALRRSLATSPAFRQPDWSKPAVARGLLPALLTGSWREGNARDSEIISDIARKPYEEVVERLVQWSIGSDPLVRRKDDAWYLVSPQDAWRLLARYIIPSDLGRFESTAKSVLRSVHPAFGLPPEQRWMAGALGYSSEYSGFLINGLVKTLAIMGVHGAELPSATSSARRAAIRVVRNLLEEANADWRLWASLSTRLSLLAEAAPDSFLDAVDVDLQRSEPVLANLFGTDGNPMSGSDYATGLLWALETLAWSADHLGRVVVLLARLDEIDPESELRRVEDRRSRSMHRPLAVLKEVFRTWAPQTSAPLDERLAALDVLRRSHGDVAWHVMRSMLPELHSVGRPTSRPSVREWEADGGRGTDEPGRARTIPEVVLRMLEDAGTNGGRWSELIGGLHMLPRTEHDLVVARLSGLDPAGIPEETKTTIWEALRELVARHRAYRTARWAMPEEYVERLEGILDQFTPDDPVVLHGWLFGPRPRFVDGGDVEDTSREEQRQRLADARVEAAVAVLNGGGVDGLIELALSVDEPYQLGFTAASASAALLDPDELLSRHLADSNRALERLAFGYAVGRSERCGDCWVIRQIERPDLALNLDQKVTLLLALPACPDTWRAAARCGEDVSLAYWRRVPTRFFSQDHLDQAVSELVAAGRPFAATDLLAFEEQATSGLASPELAARVLNAAVAVDGDHDTPSENLGSSAGILLDVLARADFDSAQLARLEWRLMPALKWHHRGPDALHELLSEDPGFFVEMLSVVYPAENEEPQEVSLEDERRAEVGYSVLSEWRTIPGGADGRVDGGSLRAWLDQALPAVTNAGRVKIGHQMIGQMLSASPHDPDGTWPCGAVREVVEELESADLEKGFRVGVYNSRGVVTKDPSAGGAAERALSEQYDGFAVAVRTAHPRMARLLRAIADWYRLDAAREDFESEMVEER